MCGICGMMDVSRHGRADGGLVRRMADVIRHRGPDGDGFYDSPDVALGMRRLSIIDVKGSDQPLFNENRTITLVFNGEIYNYRELRDQLKRRNHVLHTEGDGETVIHLYEEYGLNLFAHLRGMYAFALWDTKAERLVLAVDHVGIKPLYLHERDGLTLFASEVKALLTDSAVPRRLNLNALDTYLSFGYLIGEDTLFEGVKRLPPGHAYVVEKGKAPCLYPFWEFPKPQATNPKNDGLLIDQARDLLADAVHLHLRSDVPLGLFLSSGIDSASMLGLMSREAGGRVKTYTVGYDMDTPDNELAAARRLAEHFQADHHEVVISARDWWRGLHQYVYHLDEPVANHPAVALLLLAEETAKQVKVVLSGLGGDELFGGYYIHHTIPQALKNGQTWGRLLSPFSERLGALEGAYPAMRRYPVIGALPTYLPRLRQAALPREEAVLRIHSFDGLSMTDHLRRKLYGPDLAAAWKQSQHKEKTFRAILENSWRDDPYNTAQAVIINTWLAGNGLLTTDKVTMASSLEARVPFFDPALLKFAASVPPSLRMRSNKYVLREAMRPYLPEWAVESQKQHFSTPILKWFDHELGGFIREILLDPNAAITPFFNRADLDKLLRDHFWGRTRQVEVVFRLLLLELWLWKFLKPSVVSERPVASNL